jgi:hypothetical protein
MWAERKRAIMAMGGFGALIAVTVGIAWWSYTVSPELPEPRKKELDEVEIHGESAVIELWENDERHQWRSAEAYARTVQVSKDRNRVQAKQVYDVRIYHEGEIHFRGSAGAAWCDQGPSSKMLTLFDGVRLRQQQEDGFTLRTRELHYSQRDETARCPVPVTMEFTDAALRTPSMSIELGDETQTAHCPEQVVITTERGATLTAMKGQAVFGGDSDTVHLESSVVANMTVGEARHLAQNEDDGDAGRADRDNASGDDPDSRTRFRLHTHRLDYDVDSGEATSDTHTIVKTADGAASGDSAVLTEDVIRLVGHAEAQFDLEGEGTTRISSAEMEYLSGNDELSSPVETTIRTKDAVFVSGSARAFPSENRIVMEGGVRGTLRVD